MHHARVDRLACKDSPIHRLDARTKLIAVIVFSAFVISQPPTSLSILACYVIWPFAILIIAAIPIRFVLKQILIASPFILVLAASSLFYDRTATSVVFGPLQWTVSTGLIRGIVIIAKFAITISALMAMITTTRFSDLLAAMAKLGVPKLLVTQLGFLYRYIFMLIDKARNILRARAGRKLRNLGPKMEVKTAAAMVGTLFLDSLDTASRVHMAMQARGFTGQLHRSSNLRFSKADYIFTAILAIYLTAMQLLAGSL